MNTIKITEWIKNHKKELIISSVSMAIGVVGGIKLYKYSRKDIEAFRDDVMDVFDSIYPALKGSYAAYISYDHKEDYTVKDCPELIKELMDCDFVNNNEVITGMAIFRKKQ